MKIILIRHGETEYNRRHLFYGKTDISLNDTGVQQAYLLNEKLAGMRLEVPIYTSSLKRTIETAELIFPDQKKISLNELDEKDFGLWEGLSADQINERFPEEWEKWLISPFEVTPINAEKFSDFSLFGSDASKKARFCNCWTPGRIASYFEKMLSGV